MPKSEEQKGPQKDEQKIMQTAKKLLAELGRQERSLQTTESTAYLQGLAAEFAQQASRYHELTAHHRELEARVELAEKTLSLMRDHLAAMVNKTEFALPMTGTRRCARSAFVGLRPVDACVELLRERKKMTGAEMVAALNLGCFGSGRTPRCARFTRP